MILYHVSVETSKDGRFKPCIPILPIDGEDEEIERVCVSTSIEGCLSAIPDGGARLAELNASQRGFYRVFRIDTEKLGISDELILTADYLYEENLVPDAYWTKEHWILTAFTVPSEDSFLIQLMDWQWDEDDRIPYSIKRIAQEERNGNSFDIYAREIGGRIPGVTTIQSIIYRTNAYQSGEILRISEGTEFDESEEYPVDVERMYYVATTFYNVELAQISETEFEIVKGTLTLEDVETCLTGGYWLETEELAG